MNNNQLQHHEYKPSVFSTRLSWLAIIVVAILYLIQYKQLRSWIVKSPITWDQADYYAYLPTFLIYADPDLAIVKKNRPLYGERFKHFISAKGKPVFRMTMGVAIMNVPFFLAGHIWAIREGFPADGYSEPYYLIMWLSGIFYVLAGFVTLRQLLLRYVDDFAVALTILCVGLATNLFNYATYDALMSHAISFFLMSLFIWLTARFHSSPTFFKMAALGVVWGLITLIRPTNCLILLFFVLFDVTSRQAFLMKMRFYILHPLYLFVFMCTSFFVFFPQLLYWYVQTEQWLFYSYGEKGTFFFLHPRLADGLFSFRKGWLLYTPVMILAMLGILLLYKKQQQLFASVAVTFSLALYVMFSFWCWWYGGSFGCRPVVEYYSLLAIPLAIVFNVLALRKRVLAVTLIFAGACLWLNVKQQYYYRQGTLHWDSMSKDFYIDLMLGRPLDGTKLDPPDYEQAALDGKE
jgi:hypothetical protein